MLFIDPKTIYRHLANIRKETGVHSTIELLTFIHGKQEFHANIIKLTPRGEEIFKLTLAGKTDNQIASELSISYNCVRIHKEKMIHTNKCNSMLELISKYYNILANGYPYGN